ncbi:MAG: WYL domain-containing protein [Eubacterium sp.]|nr:WYL domain-containing protein [Eubacterium sp.]
MADITGEQKSTRTAGKTNGHKLALLYTMKYLLEETDEDHAVNASQIAAYLKNCGLAADRRTIYSDVAILQDFGMDIMAKESGNLGGYYLASRDFELPELKLLVDAVQCSKFITVKKTEELIDKLSGLTSKHNAKELQREVFIRNRSKAENEAIFYSVDAIYDAMNRNRQIFFQYGELTPDGDLVPKKGGARYQVSPWGLTWDDEKYYLIAYDDLVGKIKYYRVDKMLKTQVASEERVGAEKYEHFDVAELTLKTFGMYSGEDYDVTLVCSNSLAGVILDRFGRDARLIPVREPETGKDSGKFKVTRKISVSPQFFGWVCGIGPEIEIAGPENVRNRYRKYLEEVLNAYK